MPPPGLTYVEGFLDSKDASTLLDTIDQGAWVPIGEGEKTRRVQQFGARYDYRIHLGGSPVGDAHSFRTAPASATAPVRFAVIGDSGSGCPPQFRVARVVRALHPDLLIHTGDVVYNRADPRRITARYFIPYADLIDHIPFYPTWGNHDLKPGGGKHLRDALYLPTNDVDGSERFYDFQHGCVHFFAYDSASSPFHAGSPQHAWLVRRLAASKATWKVVYTHFPLYASGPGGGSTALREALEPVFAEHGVDLVFHGNDHIYERSHPIRKGQVRAADGTVYVVSGGGGTSVYEINPTETTAYGESVFHAGLVEAKASQLELRAYRADGSLLDQMSLTK